MKKTYPHRAVRNLVATTGLPSFGLIILLISLSNPPLQAETISFANQIRPLLSDACFQCHGPDSNKRKAKLRLDHETAAKQQRDAVWIIKEGAPESSELITRIEATDPDLTMPPPDSGKTLSAADKALIRNWIDQGANWETHWSFEPILAPEVPQVHDSDWPINPIDFFILSKLEAQGMRPSKEADAATLARRLHLDVTGLPGDVSTVRRFDASENPQDYERMIDGLLADEGFGEKMSTHWLDLVRYADTVGYHGDQPYSVWPYRDYVIDAFNQNMPFDQFTCEQIAGDLMPKATRKQKIASGFNRLHMITAEGGAQDKEYLAKYAADRVRTTAGVWLGATLACAECHDHKFDPYTMRDFYSMAAFFGDLKEKGFYGGSNWEPEMPLPTVVQAQEKEQLEQQIKKLEHTLVTSTEAIVNAQLDWEKTLIDLKDRGLLTWLPIHPESITSENHSQWIQQADDSILTHGPKPDQETFTLAWKLPPHEMLTGIRLEALTHPSMDEGSLSRGGGNFVLTELEIALKTPSGEQTLEIADSVADYAQKGFEASRAVDGRNDTGWAVDGSSKKTDRELLVTLAHPLQSPETSTLIVRLKHKSTHKAHVMGRFRITRTSVPDPILSETGLTGNIYRLVNIPWAQRSADETKQLSKHFYAKTPLLDPAREQLAFNKARLNRLDNEIPTMLVSKSVKPRTMRILPRGNWMDDSGPEVSPAIPAFLDVEGINRKDQALTRMDLANWLVSKNNPLTARNFANQLWKLYFGYGLARIMEDTGSQATPPTHPELLDWLASEFVRSQWDIKHMVRLILNSRTYRQSSTPSKYLAQVDPYNTLYARQSRFRLDAEIIRDQALQVSGLLVHQVGGPSVRPYQPVGYYSQLNFPKRTYQHDRGASQYRRGLYTHWQRTFLHPMLKAFDAPNREECTSQRSRSNTPLQSLNLLNDPSFVESARTYAAQILTSFQGSDRARIRTAFEEVTLREPSYRETQILEDLLKDMRKSYHEEPERGLALLKVGLNTAGEQCPPTELGAWTGVTRALFNLHETITRY
jgi:hypothetical protein